MTVLVPFQIFNHDVGIPLVVLVPFQIFNHDVGIPLGVLMVPFQNSNI